MPILDCDEVFNYWEPLHFLSYGDGLQTWEYAPHFALRTYAYIHPMKWYGWLASQSSVASIVAPMLVDHQVTNAKLATFILLRSTLAALSACAELLFLTAISEDVPFFESLTRQPLVSKSVSYASALLFLTSTGMTHAAGAYLPSSSVMILWMICASCYVRLQVRSFGALAVVATLCLGWPFGVIVFVPMGVDLLRRDKAPFRLLFGVALWACVVQSAVMFLDYKHYGKWTSAVLNIFRYNAQGGGDELYGIEPSSFYFKNLSLNFNYLALLALLFLPVSALLRFCRRPLPTSLVVLIAPLYLWLSVVVPRPHKEERFLFPIYPPLVLASVVVVQQAWDATFLGRRFRCNAWRQNLWILCLLPSCLISLSRSMALSKYYTAPLKVLSALPVSSPGVVCTCGEWYRFPSSYYLPEGYQLAFLPSSFSGQLPKYFEAEGSRTGSNFNDANKEEQDRYVNPESCDYIFELETSPDAECLKVMMNSSIEWTKLADEPFLNAKDTAALHRILYIPVLHKAVYNSYSLYTRVVSAGPMAT